MKKFITLIAALLFLTSVSFASPYQTQPSQNNTAKSVKKPVKKDVKKVPHRTTTVKKTATTKTPSTKPAPVSH